MAIIHIKLRYGSKYSIAIPNQLKAKEILVNFVFMGYYVIGYEIEERVLL